MQRLELTFVVSHISRKTSEMWGTRDPWQVWKRKSVPQRLKPCTSRGFFPQSHTRSNKLSQ